MTAEYVLYCFAQSGNAYKAALMLNFGGAQWLEDIKALDGWVHPYELMPGHSLQ